MFIVGVRGTKDCTSILAAQMLSKCYSLVGMTQEAVVTILAPSDRFSHYSQEKGTRQRTSFCTRVITGTWLVLFLSTYCGGWQTIL